MKSIGLIALAVLCGSAFAQHTITLNLQGLTPHVGQMFKARMVETPSGKQVAETTFTALPGPGLTLVFLGESGKSYTLDYFADNERRPGLLRAARGSCLEEGGGSPAS